MELDDNQLLRYSRHILLPEIGLEGQQRLLQSKLIIFGVGGLGSPAALYLAAAGIGEISLIDPDWVELSNLQRQIAHLEIAVGEPKVSSCAAQMHQLNSHIKINTIQHKVNGEQLHALVKNASLVLDCTDNYTARFAINQACVEQQIPLISAAAVRWEGHISVFHSGIAKSPCYHCIYATRQETDQSCSVNGVLSPLLGVLGSMQAVEAIKLLTHTGEPLIGRVLLFDALSMQWETMQLPKNPACPVCGSGNSKA